MLACGRHMVAESKTFNSRQCYIKERQWGWDIEGRTNGRKRKEAEGPPVSVPWNHLRLWLWGFFFFNLTFEMLPVVPGGGLRLRMTHWWQGMGGGGPLDLLYLQKCRIMKVSFCELPCIWFKMSWFCFMFSMCWELVSLNTSFRYLSLSPDTIKLKGSGDPWSWITS